MTFHTTSDALQLIKIFKVLIQYLDFLYQTSFYKVLEVRSVTQFMFKLNFFYYQFPVKKKPFKNSFLIFLSNMLRCEIKKNDFKNSFGTNYESLHLEDAICCPLL